MKSLVKYVGKKDPARAFIIIKPGFFKYAQEILAEYKKKGWELERQRSKQLLLTEARQLYRIHKDESWYDELCEYMASDVTTAFILKNPKHKQSQKMLDKVAKIKDMFRDKYSTSIQENVLHSSDTLEHMKEESSIYFYNI